MRPALEVQLEEHGGTAVMRLAGEFDLGGALDFEAKLQHALEHRPKTLVVDLRGLTFLDSTGLRALIRADARGRREGWRLAITRAPRTVERIFELTRTNRLFRVVDGLDGDGFDGDGTSAAAGRGWEAPRVTDLAKHEVGPARFPNRI